MARRHKLKVQFPEVLQVANAREEFEAETEAHVAWAWDLVSPLCGPWLQRDYTPSRLWQELRAHQAELRAHLDAIRVGRPKPIQGLTVPPLPHRAIAMWINPPSLADSIRSKLEWLAARRLMETLARVGEERPPANQVMDGALRVRRSREPQTPLDALYLQLWLLYEEGALERLKTCPSCGRFFLARTARAQDYCRDSCWRQANPTRPEDNQRYQRRHRAGKDRDDREAVKKAVRRERDLGARELGFEEVWAAFQEAPHPKIGRRRFKRLLREVIGADLVC